MKKLSILLTMVFGLGLFFQSCNNGKTYAEMNEEEREAIKRFIELNDIKVIDEDQFAEQDSTTDVSANEYVLFEETGVYMQVVERGNGEPLGEGRHEILVRYVEERIKQDGDSDTISLNTLSNLYAHPDEFVLTKQDKSYSATFTTLGAMYNAHTSAYVPSGWLMALNYLKVGREISGRSKIKLILPHSQGTSTATAEVFPCFYEITYQLSR
jgi:hypothetical protein